VAGLLRWRNKFCKGLIVSGLKNTGGYLNLTAAFMIGRAALPRGRVEDI
jgi:hypothetical protein